MVHVTESQRLCHTVSDTICKSSRVPLSHLSAGGGVESNRIVTIIITWIYIPLGAHGRFTELGKQQNK